MSQYPPGPDWWVASDGNWYPPEQHPSYQPPAPQAAPPQAPLEQQFPPTQQMPEQFPATQQFPPTQQWSAPDASASPPQGPPQGPPNFPMYPQPQMPDGGPVPNASPSKPSRAGLWVALLAVGVVMALIGVAVVVYSLRDSSDTASTTSAPTTTVEVESTNPGETTPRDPDKSVREDAPDATRQVEIEGPSSGPEAAVVAAAIVDIEKFWTTIMPEVYDEPYEPVTGGFFSWSPSEELPPCADSPDSIAENAFYCGAGDVVAWDDTNLIPHLYETYGDLSVAIVFAHEWGHAVQARVRMRGETVTLEQQADCFAGAWVSHVRDAGSEFFEVDGAALDRALGGFIEIADSPGTAAQDPNAHGSAFDRINSFQQGLEEGAASCAEYNDVRVANRLVEIPFTGRDFETQGNAPYADIIDLTTTDLEEFWSSVSTELFDTKWKALEPAVPFDSRQSDPPECGGSDTSGYSLFYCVDGRFIAYDDGRLFPDVYEELGDFAVGALYGSQYSLAAQDQLDIAPEQAKDQNLLADCLTGSWAASIFNRQRENPESEALVLSAGDLDEAVKVLLALGSTEDDGGDQGSGFERVSAFRNGVIGGVAVCTGE